ncbi:MAG: family 16 glycoside hydrolase [Fibrobacteria bacterium]
MRIGNKFLGMRALSAALLIGVVGAKAEDSAWVSIIPKTDTLEGWSVKFEGSNRPVGLNPGNTFRLSPEGYLWANNNLSRLQTGYGQLYYTKRKLSYYIVRAEYNFPVEKSAPDFPDWTIQNNGLLIHTAEPATSNGSWPTSLEVQLLGPKNMNEDKHRPNPPDWPVGLTANLCLPGDNITVTTKTNPNHTNHCWPATYPQAWKGTRIPWEGAWSDVTVRVIADSLIQHIIRGQVVFEYTKIRMTSGGTPRKDGYLSIQAEGTPTLFRKLDILDLEGCMDKTSPAFRSYFVKSKPAACSATSIAPSELFPRFALTRDGAGLRLEGTGARIASVRKADGTLVQEFPISGTPVTRYTPRSPGMYLVTVAATSGARTTSKVPFF